MIDRLTDWKTTIAGLLICAVIIAALVTRPEWGATDLAAFAGAIGTALLGALSRSSAPATEPAKPAVPPVGAIGTGLVVLLAVGTFFAAGLAQACTPAAQATAAQVGGAALAAVDGPACELVEVRSGSALAGVVCEGAAGLLERYLASVGSTSQALTSSGARAPAARCRLVPVHAGGAHVGFACEEHASALVAALARDGGA